MFCDTWAQCINDVSRFAKECDAAASGRLAAEKQAYMSLPRPGVSSRNEYLSCSGSPKSPSPTSDISLNSSRDLSSYSSSSNSKFFLSNGPDSFVVVRQRGDCFSYGSGINKLLRSNSDMSTKIQNEIASEFESLKIDTPN